MAASIEDVARRAGVSVATVSRALRGLPNVAPPTRAKVQRAATELHYVADPSASRLATRRTATVGMVVPKLRQWYYSQVFAGAEQVFAGVGYDILPFVLSTADVRTGFLDELPFRKRVDGLILVDTPLATDECARLRATDVRMVVLGTSCGPCTSLTIDNVAAAREAVEHLLELGHRRIATLSSDPDDAFRLDAPSARDQGYRAAFEAFGVEPDPCLAAVGGFTMRGGARGMDALLALPDPPTAVFAHSDEMAVGAMHAARRAGIEVPGGLSIVGFDDHDVAEFVGLTTVRQEVLLQGEMAAHRLLHLLGGADTVVHETVPTRLVVRESTAPPPDGAGNPARADATGRKARKTLAGDAATDA